MATKTGRPRPLQSFANFRTDKRRIIAVASRAAIKAAETGDYRQLVAALAILQLLMARRAVQAVADQLEEQAIAAPPVAGAVATEALAGISQLGIPLDERLDFAAAAPGDTVANVLRVVLTEIGDTSRVTTGVDLMTRPGIAGYVRYLNPPSCSRCVILAGRVYHTDVAF